MFNLPRELLPRVKFKKNNDNNNKDLLPQRDRTTRNVSQNLADCCTTV